MKWIKKWFENLSGSTKFMLILCLILTITNMGVIIWGIVKNKEVVEVAENIFDSDKEKLFLFIGAGDLFQELKYIFKTILCILINVIGYYISYYIGKSLDYFKSIAEFFINLRDDGWGYFFILTYNVISMFFDTYTILSFVI